MDKDNTVGTLVIKLSTLSHVGTRFKNLLHSGVDGLVDLMQVWSFRESYQARGDLSRCVFTPEIA